GDVAPLLGPLGRALPRNPDPDLALNALERFLAQPAARARLPELLDGRGRTLDALLHLLGTSQFFGDVLAADPDAADLLRSLRRPTFADLHAQLQPDVAAARDDAGLLRAFRRFRRRQTLRVGVADVIRDRPLDDVTRDISRAAEVAIEVALATALRQLA